MRVRGIFTALLALITLGALLYRLPDLGNRPMHGDEAVHALKFRELWEKGVYRYDPNEFHGPTLYYAALPSVWLHGRKNFAATTEADYRLPIALFGAALLLLFLPLVEGGLGRQPILWASLFMAISPAFVFYSRDYIQEILLIFFTAGAIACGWRYTRTLRSIWLMTSAVCGGLMVATKETAVLTFAAAAVALGLTILWTRFVDKTTLNLRRLWKPRAALFAFGVALLTACLFLSGFLTHPVGPLDYLRSYTPWLHRAHETDLHRHTWDYYLRILAGQLPPEIHDRRGPLCSERLILSLALIGFLVCLLPKNRTVFRGNLPLARWIAFYTATLTVFYSAIPYKTPWCILNPLLGLILLTGIGATALVSHVRGRLLKTAASLLLLLGGGQLGWQSYQASFHGFADARNPYVYAQPVPDVVELGHRMETLSKASPLHDAMPIYVLSIDTYYWPLPWYLRQFPNVGYWTHVPQNTDVPIILASPEFDDDLTKRLDATHLMTGYRGLRPGVFFEVWVRLDLWKSYLDARKSIKKEGPGE